MFSACVPACVRVCVRVCAWLELAGRLELDLVSYSDVLSSRATLVLCICVTWMQRACALLHAIMGTRPIDQSIIINRPWIANIYVLQLRDMTSGASTSDTQLVLHGWHMIKEDPYFKPATEEELEEYGAWFSSGGGSGTGAIANHAKILVDRIRMRKGR